MQGVSVGVVQRVTDALDRGMRNERFRQWRLQDGPSRSYRTVIGHPLIVTAAVACVVGGGLALTFGVPPVSPLFLVFVVVVAPLPLWLRMERDILAGWDRQDPPSGQ